MELRQVSKLLGIFASLIILALTLAAFVSNIFAVENTFNSFGRYANPFIMFISFFVPLMFMLLPGGLGALCLWAAFQINHRPRQAGIFYLIVGVLGALMVSGLNLLPAILLIAAGLLALASGPVPTPQPAPEISAIDNQAAPENPALDKIEPLSDNLQPAPVAQPVLATQAQIEVEPAQVSTASPAFDLPMSPPDLVAFRQAVAMAMGGQKAEAYRQLKALEIKHPHTVSLLLWIAYTTPSSEEARRTIELSARLEPHNESVAQAQQWLLAYA